MIFMVPPDMTLLGGRKFGPFSESPKRALLGAFRCLTVVRLFLSDYPVCPSLVFLSCEFLLASILLLPSIGRIYFIRNIVKQERFFCFIHPEYCELHRG